MARGRMLSKTLSVSRRFNAIAESAGDLTEFTQLLFAILVPHTDDFGRMSGDPFSLKMTVLPASQRPLSDFTAALNVLHEVQLLTVYAVDGDIWLQVSKFDEHQAGLHKRTTSSIPDMIPGNSRKFPEIPGNSWSRARAELNRTEGKGTEEKGTEKNSESNNKLVRSGSPHTTSAPPLKKGNGHSARSKRPIFSGQRLTVFEWMFDDCCQILGPAFTDAFRLDEWFFELDAELAKSAVVIPKRDGGIWLMSQLLAEAKRRGLPIALSEPSEQPQQRSRIQGSVCQHEPRCRTTKDCIDKVLAEGRSGRES